MELDGFRVPFGDGSLRLMDPRPSEHTGSYTCVFSMPYNTHTEHTDVTIEDPVGEVTNTNPVRDQRGPCANWFTEATGPDKYNHVLVRLSTLPVSGSQLKVHWFLLKTSLKAPHKYEPSRK